MNALNRPNMQIAQRVASAMRDEDAHGWRAEVEGFITATGARPELCHVTEAQWERRFLAGEGPQEAVLAELANFEG